MPVEAVHLVEREQVDELLDELLRLEMARDVEVSAAPGEPRRVFDRHRRDLPALPADGTLAEDRRG